MRLSLFGYTFVIFIVTSFVGALVAAVMAWKRRTLFISDAGTVLLAPLLFYVLGSVRPEFLVGWGMTVWPFATLVFGSLLFAFRVLVLDNSNLEPKRSSITLCILYVSSAVLGGLFMPPLYE